MKREIESLGDRYEGVLIKSVRVCCRTRAGRDGAIVWPQYWASVKFARWKSAVNIMVLSGKWIFSFIIMNIILMYVQCSPLDRIAIGVRCASVHRSNLLWFVNNLLWAICILNLKYHGRIHFILNTLNSYALIFYHMAIACGVHHKKCFQFCRLRV